MCFAGPQLQGSALTKFPSGWALTHHYERTATHPVGKSQPMAEHSSGGTTASHPGKQGTPVICPPTHHFPMALLNLLETVWWWVLPLCLLPPSLNSGPVLHLSDGFARLPHFLSPLVSLMKLWHVEPQLGVCFSEDSDSPGALSRADVICLQLDKITLLLPGGQQTVGQGQQWAR